MNAEQVEGLFDLSFEVPGLESDRIFEVFIETCISINCRQSGTRVLSEWLELQGCTCSS